MFLEAQKDEIQKHNATHLIQEIQFLHIYKSFRHTN